MNTCYQGGLMAGSDVNSNTNPDPSIVLPPTFFIQTPELNVTSSQKVGSVDTISLAGGVLEISLIESDAPKIDSPNKPSAQYMGQNLALKQHEIVMQMLDKWLDDISKQKILDEEAAKKIDIQKRDILLHEMRREIEREQESKSQEVMTLGLVFAATGIQSVFLPSIDAGMMSVQPIADAASRVATDLNLDIAVQMGIIGAIYSLGVQTLAFQVAAKDAVNGKMDPTGKDFAKGFAENTLELLKDPNFNVFLTAIVARAIGKGEKGDLGVKTTPETMVNLLRLSLLASSLALLYKSNTGGLSGLEFLLKQEKESSLYTAVREQMSLLLTQLGDTGKKALASLNAYFTSQMKDKDLADPSQTLRAISHGLNAGELGA